MSILVAVGISLLAVAAVTVVGYGLKSLLDKWGEQRTMPESVRVEMSETDERMIKRTQKLIRRCFGENPAEELGSLSNKERVERMADFADRLASEYGLDIEIDIMADGEGNMGAYQWNTKKALFNVSLLLVDKDDPMFEYCMRETLDTIVHELRHAVQHRAIQKEGFWDVSLERLEEWAHNMLPENYIDPEVDWEGYVNQPIERDAATFAASVMEGVY